MIHAVLIALVLALAPASQRRPSVVLAELATVNFPKVDSARSRDPEYMKGIQAERLRVGLERDRLIRELYELDPGHDKLGRMLHERWERMRVRAPCATMRETAEVLASPAPRPYHADAGYQRVLATFACEGGNPAPGLDRSLVAIGLFAERFPGETRSAKRIISRVSRYFPNADEQLEIYARLRKAWPEGEIGERIALMTRQAEGVGQPFELAFENAMDGTHVDIGALRGKVVLIDFWATWCGPCRAELPHLEEIQAKYRDEGLEVIGVSLDDKGADAMKNFCVAQGMTWPQYYQGARWDAPFSRGWGVTSIPRVFLVGRGGKLRSVSARGRLDELVPKLLAEPAGGMGAQRSPSSSR